MTNVTRAGPSHEPDIALPATSFQGLRAIAGVAAVAAEISEVARFARRVPPIVVETVRVSNWRLREEFWIDFVETYESDRDEVAAGRVRVFARKRAHATMFAE
jgi:hypothetical protein